MTGITSHQMRTAPYGATFVSTVDYQYAENLAHKLNRDDLHIVGLNWLTRDRVIGRRLCIVIDHYAKSIMSEENERAYEISKVNRRKEMARIRVISVDSTLDV